MAIWKSATIRLCAADHALGQQRVHAVEQQRQAPRSRRTASSLGPVQPRREPDHRRRGEGGDMRRDAEVSVLQVALERGAVAPEPRPCEPPRHRLKHLVRPAPPRRARPLGAPDRRAGAADPAASRPAPGRWCACPGGARRRPRSPAPWPAGSPSGAPPPGGSRPRGRGAGRSTPLRSSISSAAAVGMRAGHSDHRRAHGGILRPRGCQCRPCVQYLLACKHLSLPRKQLTPTPAPRRGPRRADEAAPHRHELGVLRHRRATRPLVHPGEDARASCGRAEAPLTVKALSDRLGLSLPAVSRAVESAGQARRGQARGGPRTTAAARTWTSRRKGRDTFDQLAARRMAGIQHFVEGMDPSEREALAAALRPIVERTKP